ncbi:glucose dehydrogenase [FAD, quinone]-like [Trichoplusia ni]|uniref:Glucose dehydrogenase [FAD, quinone]-like n=1 Tax=Trichoplusia ni TaxID=7111 RepID=A0A7E5WJ91_TRINI|nr:glucose dehydrogenase [FAD, quinone]-like [Trichoplusia ni]
MSWACDPALTANIVNSYGAAGTLFTQTLTSFLAAQCAVVGDHLWPDDAIDAVLKDPNYDFIVVGAGSAGSVVANRLSEVPDWKVLLIEAGGNPQLSTVMPQVFYNSMKTDLDWGYKTQPQNSCRSYKNKACAWPRGKVLGGCGSINAMFYVRGNRLDYDTWAADGNYGWSYDDVLPYFIKSEKYNGQINEETKKYHGKDGYLNIEDSKDYDFIERLIVEAAVELGMKNSTDINGDSQMGIILAQSNVKGNVRHGPARAFLSPVKDRKNLHVLKNSHVTKILFIPGTNKVSGVKVHKNGKEIIVNARKEVVVSGGAINSPQILMLSGIGPRKHLEEMDIEVKVDLPVGENLQDHVFAPTFYTVPGDTSLASLENIVRELGNYMLAGTGAFKDVRPHRVISFANTTDPTSTSPDIQFHYLVLPPKSRNMLDVFEKHDLNEEVYNKFHELNSEKIVILVFSVVLHPKSSGTILLKNKNPFEHPLIYANYFEDREDMETIIRATKQHSLKLGDTNAFKKIGLQLEWLEIDACKEFEKASDEHLECIARELTFSLYHPTSTVKMGPKSDKGAVVDPELRVYGVEGLRVADASIMPFVVRGNTNVPTMMIGEKAADMIKKFWTDRHQEL